MSRHKEELFNSELSAPIDLTSGPGQAKNCNDGDNDDDVTWWW